MKKEINKGELIIEDVVYFEKVNGKYVNNSKSTFQVLRTIH